MAHSIRYCEFALDFEKENLTIAGWICLIIPGFKTDITSPVLFYVGRILTGLGGGGFALAPPVYCSEITETSIRGAMGAMMQFMLTIGTVYTLGQ